jgi:hypothetical protein
MSGLTYAEGNFPFCVPGKVNPTVWMFVPYGESYEPEEGEYDLVEVETPQDVIIWDGSTRYEYYLTTDEAPEDLRWFPSSRSDVYMPVVGDGTGLIGLNLEQMSLFYWGIRQAKLTLTGVNLAASVGSLSIVFYGDTYTASAFSHSSTGDLALGNYLDSPIDTAIRRLIIGNPWKDAKNGALDYIPCVVCGKVGFYQSQRAPNDVGSFEQDYSGAPFAITEISTNISSAESGAHAIRISVPLIPKYYVEEKFWIPVDVSIGISTHAYANENDGVSGGTSREDRAKGYRGYAFINEGLSDFNGFDGLDAWVLSDESFVIKFSDTDEASVKLLKYTSTYSETSGSGAGSPSVSAAMGNLVLEPLKYFTLDGIYDEDTGQPV